MVGNEISKLLNRIESDPKLRMHIQNNKEIKLQNRRRRNHPHHKVQEQTLLISNDRKLSPTSPKLLFVATIRPSIK